MTDNTIHIILCSFQGEEYIEEQLNSLLAQSYQDIEIYVFDDCSTDNTIGVVNKAQEQNRNVHLKVNEKNIGFLKNYENAIKQISGSYISLCDQDDIWYPEKLSVSMEAMKLLEKQYPDTPVLVHSDLELIDEMGKEVESSFFQKKNINLPSEKSVSSILGHCGVMGNTILMNKLLVRKALPFPDGLKYHDYWLALVNELFGVRKTISKPLVKYRIHTKNTSNNNRHIVKEDKTVKPLVRDYLLPFKEDNRELAISHLLTRYDLDSSDKALIIRFLEYLIFKGKRFPHFRFLMEKGLLKEVFTYRVSVFFRMMLSKRYD